MKRLSIIIPVYNSKKYIQECLDSVLQQGLSLEDFEVIVINDGSTDGSLELLRKYEKEYCNVIVLNQDNKGLSHSRNVGLTMASGKYTLFLDSDDFLEPDCLPYMLQKCEQFQLDAYLFDAVVFHEDVNYSLSIFHKDSYNRLKSYGLFHNGIDMFYNLSSDNKLLVSVTMYLVRTNIYKGNDLTFVEDIIHEDEIFTLKLIPYLGPTMHENLLFYHRRVRSNSIMTSGKNIERIRNYLIVFDHLRNLYLQSNNTAYKAILRFKLAQIIRSISRLICLVDVLEDCKRELALTDEIVRSSPFLDFKTLLFFKLSIFPLTHRWLNKVFTKEH